MYQHQGLAWVFGVQAIIRLSRRSLEAADTPKGLQDKLDILAQANKMSTAYVEEKSNNRYQVCCNSVLSTQTLV
eukprot:7278794-Karenia_brevis.AAC.1